VARRTGVTTQHRCSDPVDEEAASGTINTMTRHLTRTARVLLSLSSAVALSVTSLSAWTSSTAAAATAGGVPSPPISVEADPGAGSATVVWSPSVDPGSSAIIDYEVTSRPSSTTCKVAAAPFRCEFAPLTNGQPYTFSVRAMNSQGYSTAATFGPVRPSAPPSAPTGITATPQVDGLLVRWSPPAERFGTVIGSYQAKAYANGAVSGTCVPGAGLHECLISGLALGGLFSVGVTAISDAGAPGAEGLAAAPVPYVFAPAPPTDVQLLPGDGTITVSWTPSATDGGMAIDRYTANVTDQRGASKGTCEFRPSPNATPACTVSGLENGTVVAATVVATNQVGSSKPSTPSPTSAPEIGEASSIDEAFARLLKGIKVDLRSDGATVNLTIPKTTKIGGISVHGTASVRFEADKVSVWTLDATFPGLLGGSTGTLEAVVQDKKVISLVTSAKTGTIGGLFAVHNASLTFVGAEWKVAATVGTPDGKTTQLDGSLSYDLEGKLVGGGIGFTGLSLAGLIDINTFRISYSPTAGYSGGMSFTALPDGQGNGTGASVNLGFSPEGKLTSGLVEARSPIDLFGVIELRTFRLSFDSGADRWDANIDAAPQFSAGGRLSGGAASFVLKVEGGSITGASFTLTKFGIAGVVGIDKAHFSYEAGPGFETYTVNAAVVIPGAAGSTIGGSFTFRNGRYLDGSVEAKHLSVHITHGVFLQSLNATISIGSETQPWHLGGGAAISYGPSTAGASPVEVGGTIDYTFPTERAVLGAYAMTGQLMIGGIEIGNGLLSMSAENPVVAVASLGPGDGSVGLAYGSGARVTGLLKGEILSSSFSLRGDVSVAFSSYVFGASTLVNQRGLGACGTSDLWGSTGVIWPWTASPYLMVGDCSLGAF